MKKIKFLRATLLAATLVVAGYGGIKALDFIPPFLAMPKLMQAWFWAVGLTKTLDYSHAKKVNSDDAMLIANIEALSDGEEGGEETVKCYCKKKILAPNVCTVMGSGGYCGGDPCSNHDGNCR